MAYPEITQLSQLQEKHKFSIVKSDETAGGFVPVKVSLDGYSCHLLLEDEYGDFDESKSVLSLFLTLATLEIYKESTDYLTWCKYSSVDPLQTDLSEYYKELGNIYQELEQRLGKVEAFISPFDHQLRSGAFQELLKMK